MPISDLSLTEHTFTIVCFYICSVTAICPSSCTRNAGFCIRPNVCYCPTTKMGANCDVGM